MILSRKRLISINLFQATIRIKMEPQQLTLLNITKHCSVLTIIPGNEYYEMFLYENVLVILAKKVNAKKGEKKV